MAVSYLRFRLIHTWRTVFVPYVTSSQVRTSVEISNVSNISVVLVGTGNMNQTLSEITNLCPEIPKDMPALPSCKVRTELCKVI